MICYYSSKFKSKFFFFPSSFDFAPVRSLIEEEDFAWIAPSREATAKQRVEGGGIYRCRGKTVSIVVQSIKNEKIWRKERKQKLDYLD